MRNDVWLVGALLLAGCAGGELDGMDDGRFNPDGTPVNGTPGTTTGPGADAGTDALEGDPDAGSGEDGGTNEDASTPPPTEPRAHCILNDASVAHLGTRAATIDDQGLLRVVAGGDAIRLFTRRPDADWSEKLVAESGDAPSVAASGTTIAVAWVDRFGAMDPGTSRIRLAEQRDGVWDDAETIAQIPSAPGHDTLVDVAFDASGTAWLAWFQESDVGQVLRVAHRDAGAWDVDTVEHGFRYVRPTIEVTSDAVVVGMAAPTRLAVVERRDGSWGPIEELEPEKVRSSDDLVLTNGTPGFAVQFDPHPAWGVLDDEGQEVMRCDTASNGHPLATTVLQDGTVTSIRSVYQGPSTYSLAATSGCQEVSIPGTTHRQPPVHSLVGDLYGSKVAALRKGSYAAVGEQRLFVHVDQASGALRAVWSNDGGQTWEVDDLLAFHNFGYSPAVAAKSGRTLVASVDLATQHVWVSEQTTDGWESERLPLGDCRVTEVEEGTIDVEIGPERAYVAVAAKCPESFLRVNPMVFAEQAGGWSAMDPIDYDRVGDLLIDLAVMPDGEPALAIADGIDEYRYEWDGTAWDRGSISSLGSSGRARPSLAYGDDRRVTVVSTFGGLDVWMHRAESSDRVGIDHPSGDVSYDVELGDDGVVRLAHATQDDEVITVRYVEIAEQEESAAVVLDEFVAGFTSLEPTQGIDLRLSDEGPEILVAPGDGKRLRRLTRAGASWRDEQIVTGDDTPWFPRFLGDGVLYHDRARADLCVGDL